MVRVENVKNIIDSQYNGSLTAFAHDLGVSLATVSRILKKKREVGKVVLQKFNQYCKKKSLELEYFIFLG